MRYLLPKPRRHRMNTAKRGIQLPIQNFFNSGDDTYFVHDESPLREIENSRQNRRQANRGRQMHVEQGNQRKHGD